MRSILGNLLLGLLGACTVAACGDLAAPPVRPRASEAAAPLVAFEPAAQVESVPPVVHVLLDRQEASGALDDAVVLTGQASSKNLSDLANGDLSGALAARVIEVVRWRSEDGRTTIAPLTPLAPDERYSVALPSQRWSFSFSTATRDDRAVLARVWPPSGMAGAAAHAVWCEGTAASGKVAWNPRRVTLWPSGISGTLADGALEGLGQGCISWRADEPATSGEVVPPPLVQRADGSWVFLEPGLLTSGAAPEVTLSTCGVGQQETAALCLEAQDDRALVRARRAPLLLGFSTSGGAGAAVLGEGGAVTLRPLEPRTRSTLALITLGLQGAVLREAVEVETGGPRPHVVINEVMANPVGPEPQQEWIELFNDGSTAVELAGWKLEDTGAAIELPSASLPAGAFALVVSEAYDAGSWVDAAPAPGTLLVRVPVLGRAGLSNGGEPIRLVSPDGSAESRVPSIASGQQGRSIMRTAPDANDDPTSFVVGPEGGTPGRANG